MPEAQGAQSRGLRSCISGKVLVPVLQLLHVFTHITSSLFLPAMGAVHVLKSTDDPSFPSHFHVVDYLVSFCNGK